MTPSGSKWLSLTSLMLVLGMVGLSCRRPAPEYPSTQGTSSSSDANTEQTSGDEEATGPSNITGVYLQCGQIKPKEKEGVSITYRKSIGCGLYDKATHIKAPEGEDADWAYEVDEQGDVEVKYELTHDDSPWHAIYDFRAVDEESLNRAVAGAKILVSTDGNVTKTIDLEEVEDEPNIWVYYFKYPDFELCKDGGVPIGLSLYRRPGFYNEVVLPLLGEQEEQNFWTWVGKNRNDSVEGSPLIANLYLFGQKGPLSKDYYEFRPEGVYDQIIHKKMPADDPKYLSVYGHQLCTSLEHREELRAEYPADN